MVQIKTESNQNFVFSTQNLHVYMVTCSLTWNWHTNKYNAHEMYNTQHMEKHGKYTRVWPNTSYRILSLKTVSSITYSQEQSVAITSVTFFTRSTPFITMKSCVQAIHVRRDFTRQWICAYSVLHIKSIQPILHF